ncbi:ERGIC2 [Bugula neritina]|uniref:ERGIC2 n=1 Tax=Bugula neritina TaxID=10212 RepID=A0A7J7IX14_BUGNE|nr:ERGIC2 [Bugula neritina]KAF6018077.1 ERGIC2 [Bugula neritina]
MLVKYAIDLLCLIHINMYFIDYNFSHRIHHLSFGDAAYGRIHPLDGDEHITPNRLHIYQYFIKVVPTKVNTRFSNVDTYQFAVTERNRALDHNTGSHGTPGIFLKYDFSPIKVYVEQKYKPLWKFLIRLCGIVGGIFACTGILNSLFGAILDIICCRFKLGNTNRVRNQTLQLPIAV